MTRPAHIMINLSALQINLQQVKQLAPSANVLAMVKSNGYGHGLVRAAHALNKADALGVACIEEALQLRESGIAQPIVLMEGLFDEREISLALRHGLTLVVHHVEQLIMLEKQAATIKIPVWLKINTGMQRLGFAPNQVLQAYTRLNNCAVVQKPIGLMTHFANSDSLDRTPTMQQMDIFEQVTAGFQGPRSLANSAAIIAWPSTHADWVRPGIMLYGTSPFSSHRGMEHDLQPVMSLCSELIAIQDVPKQSSVGYGGTWTCPEDMRIGIVGIGYGDGYPWHAKNGTPILVNGRPCPLIGRVAMDMLTVDLRTQPAAKIGDSVILWGPGLPVEVIAEHSGTIAYELLTRITQRVHVVEKTS